MSIEILHPFEECLSERQRARPKQPQGAKKTILVVEADGALLEVIVNILRWAGYEVLAVHTSPEAISICKRSAVTIDLILTDFNLPAGNGAEFAESVTA